MDIIHASVSRQLTALEVRYRQVCCAVLENYRPFVVTMLCAHMPHVRTFTVSDSLFLCDAAYSNTCYGRVVRPIGGAVLYILCGLGVKKADVFETEDMVRLGVCRRGHPVAGI